MMNAKQLIRDAEQRLMTETHKELKDASAVELHNAISGAAMDALAPLWKKKEDERFPRRKAAYLSMEFLVGRLVYNNLYCMGLLDETRALLQERASTLPPWMILKTMPSATAASAVLPPVFWTARLPAMFP